LGYCRIDAVVDQQPSIDCAFDGDETHPRSVAQLEPVLSKDTRPERQLCSSIELRFEPVARAK
jgi:hypothetical protein